MGNCASGLSRSFAHERGLQGTPGVISQGERREQRVGADKVRVRSATSLKPGFGA